MSSQNPLVSCLCITRNRVDLLKRAVACYESQTYAHKELVVLYEGDDIETKEYIETLALPEIIPIEVPLTWNLSLGKLRNLAIDKCNGTFFCQWDDDDWYHHQRIEFQMRVIEQSGFPACILMHWIVFDSLDSTAYISPFWPWEGSLLCAKQLINPEFQYADKKKEEDTPLVKKLFSHHHVFPVMMPKLYIYVYHLKNTWDYEHWQSKIISRGKPLSPQSSDLIAGILAGRFSVKEGSEMLDHIEH